MSKPIKRLKHRVCVVDLGALADAMKAGTLNKRDQRWVTRHMEGSRG